MRSGIIMVMDSTVLTEQLLYCGSLKRHSSKAYNRDIWHWSPRQHLTIVLYIERPNRCPKPTVLSIMYDIPQLPKFRECHSREIIFPVFLTRLIRIKDPHLVSN